MRAADMKLVWWALEEGRMDRPVALKCVPPRYSDKARYSIKVLPRTCRAGGFFLGMTVILVLEKGQVKGDAREEAPVALDETGQGVRR